MGQLWFVAVWGCTELDTTEATAAAATAGPESMCVFRDGRVSIKDVDTQKDERSWGHSYNLSTTGILKIRVNHIQSLG